MATRTLNVVIAGDTKGVSRATKQAEGSLDRLGKSGSRTLSHLKTGFLALGAAAAGGAVLGLKKSAEAAIESEKANARLQAQLRALGISYRDHEKQIQRVIDRHSQLSGFDDEDLGDSFTNIIRVVGDVNKALDLNAIAMDFARARGMDLAKAGELIGKVAGGNVGVLSRYGIALTPVTKASDELSKATGKVSIEQRRAAAESDKQATAQKALGLLQERFAGQARAYGNTTAGASDRAKVALENLGEEIGARVTPLIARLAEGFNRLVRQFTLGRGPGGRVRAVLEEIGAQAVSTAGSIRGLVGWFQRHRTTTTVLLSVLTGLTAAMVAYKIAAIAAAVATRTLAIAVGVLNVVLRANPVGLVVTAIIALGAALVTAYRRSETFRKIVNAGFDHVKRNARVMATLFRATVIPVFNALKDAAEFLWDKIEKVAKAFRGLGSVGRGMTNALGPLGAVLRGVGDGLGTTAQDMASIPRFGGGLMGARPEMAPIAGLASRFGLGVSSGLRSGARTSTGRQSWHATGEAIDVSGPSSGMMGFARFMSKRAGSLAELIYTPLGAWSNGQRYTPTGSIAAQHYDHVHVAMDVGAPGQGDGIGQAVNAARAAGFRGADLVRAVAIAGAESRYDAQAENLKYPDHSIGFWQINQLAHKGRFGSDAQLKDPFRNARAAYMLFRESGFRPWTTWPTAAQAYMDRARAAVQGGGRGTGGSRAPGGAGGRAGITPIGGTGPRTETPTGPGVALGMEGQLARVGVSEARAQASDNLSKLIAARKAKRAILQRRLNTVTKALRRKMRKARRVRLLNEQAQLVEEIDALTESISEYEADVRGGATTITRAEELEAGVDTSVDAGGGAAGTGGTAVDTGAADLAAALNALRAEMAANRAFAERVQSTENFQLKKYLADVLGAQVIGYGVTGRSFTPGSGVEFAY